MPVADAELGFQPCARSITSYRKQIPAFPPNAQTSVARSTINGSLQYSSGLARIRHVPWTVHSYLRIKPLEGSYPERLSLSGLRFASSKCRFISIESLFSLERLGRIYFPCFSHPNQASPLTIGLSSLERPLPFALPLSSGSFP